MTTNDLFLHEEILLLALKDEEGTIASGTTYEFAAGGAILAELLLQKRVRVSELGKMLPEYCAERGWTEEGVPTNETLARLGL